MPTTSLLALSDGGTGSTSTNPVTRNAANLTDNAIVRGDGGTTGVQSSTITVTDAGEMVNTSQPAFLTYSNTGVTNVTGDGTLYTVIFDTEVYDQNSDFNLGTSTFTAPVTGRYHFCFSVLLSGGTSITAGGVLIATSNRTYRTSLGPGPGAALTSGFGNIALTCDMDTSDTATFQVVSTDSGGKIDDVIGVSGGTLRTFASGELLF